MTAYGKYGLLDITVLASPTCPVERPGENCTRLVQSGTITIQPGGVTRDLGNGAVGVNLEAGTYTLTVSTPEAMSCQPATVRVAAGQTATITVDCDTGIR